MSAATYAATLGTAYVVGLAMIGALAVYLLDRVTARRHRPIRRLPDPYAEAQALAARRRAEQPRVPVNAGRGGAPWW